MMSMDGFHKNEWKILVFTRRSDISSVARMIIKGTSRANAMADTMVVDVRYRVGSGITERSLDEQVMAVEP